MKYWKYLKYLLRHIYYVRKACWYHGLWWQGLVHDLSKFRPSELKAYANFFYGADNFRKSEPGEDTAFDRAWLLHQRRNPHHWQYWVLLEDSGDIRPLEMPLKYAKEMLCDWWGASMAQGSGGRCRAWYHDNQYRLKLHPNTRDWVEKHVSDFNFGIRSFHG